MGAEQLQKVGPWAGGAILVLALRGLGMLDGPAPAPPPAPIVWPAAAQAAAQAPTGPQAADIARLSVLVEALDGKLGDFTVQLTGFTTVLGDLRERVTALEARR